MELRELSLFSGAGGGLLATKHLLKWRTVGYVEFEPYCQAILAQRIADGYLDPAPIFGDIRRFISEGYAEAYKGMVDIITGGFPCQPFSVAGKRKGEQDERNMWPATRDTICIIRPKYVFLENVPGLLSSGYVPTIFGELAEAGYDARWTVLGADDVGQKHKRKRLWIVAYSKCEDDVEHVGLGRVSGEWKKRKEIRGLNRDMFELVNGEMAPEKWKSERYGIDPRPLLLRNTNGMGSGLDQLKAIGNGQVPQVAAIAWKILSDGIT